MIIGEAASSLLFYFLYLNSLVSYRAKAPGDLIIYHPQPEGWGLIKRYSQT
jgi:hypothetical protein